MHSDYCIVIVEWGLGEGEMNEWTVNARVLAL